MPFNELNSIENFFVQQLSGVDLNGRTIAEQPLQYGVHWQYLPAAELMREHSEVLVESELKKAHIRLNPEYIAHQSDRADEVIYKLRSILLSVNSVGLVRTNEEFAKWMKGEMTMPFGQNYQHEPVRLIDLFTKAYLYTKGKHTVRYV